MAAHYFRRNLSYIGFDGSGRQVRDFLHVDDFCELLLEQIGDFETYHGRLFNVGGGLAFSLSLIHIYSPAEVVSSEKVPVMGNPETKRICTSHIERQNLTIRMQMRRMTRLTNAFSKKWDNLWSAYCLHFAYYNFCRTHKTLRVTPAMEAGIVDHIWDCLLYTSRCV